MVETRSTRKATAGEPSDESELTEQSPSPSRTLEPLITTDVFSSNAFDATDRIKALERNVLDQKQVMFDLVDLIQDLRTSLSTLTAAQSTSNVPKVTKSLMPPPKKESETRSKTANPSPTAPAHNRIKPGTPQDFDGNHEKGRAFLNSCRLYISLCSTEFADEQAKIHWVLSYMKSGHASAFADRVLTFEDRTGKDKYRTWDDFRKAFVASFCPEDEAMTARMRLEETRYFQGWRTANDFIDEFVELVDKSEYTEELAIVIKFRRGLDSDLQNKIAESRVDCPADDDVEGWYEAARHLDLNRLANEAFNGTSSRRSATAMASNGLPQ